MLLSFCMGTASQDHVLSRFFRELEASKVRYLLVGGLAMNLHGVPRMTMDVDIILAMDEPNLQAFFEGGESPRIATRGACKEGGFAQSVGEKVMGDRETHGGFCAAPIGSGRPDHRCSY